MDKQAVEAQLCQLPISQYAWIDPQTIEFSDRIRYVCEHECPMYGTSWACPPAVGTVAACRERILSYPGALVFTTLCEVDDIADLSAALATRAPHEAVPPPGTDVPLRGELRHRRHGPRRAERHRILQRQHRHLVFAPVLPVNAPAVPLCGAAGFFMRCFSGYSASGCGRSPPGRRRPRRGNAGRRCARPRGRG